MSALPKPEHENRHGSNALAYRDLARAALESVGEYNARAYWFESANNPVIAAEYRKMAQEALDRAQYYKALAELSEKQG